MAENVPVHRPQWISVPRLPTAVTITVTPSAFARAAPAGGIGARGDSGAGHLRGSSARCVRGIGRDDGRSASRDFDRSGSVRHHPDPAGRSDSRAAVCSNVDDAGRTVTAKGGGGCVDLETRVIDLADRA